MKRYTFDSRFRFVGSPLRGGWTDEEIKNEPMFFQSDLQFVAEHCGPIMRNFLCHLPNEVFHDEFLVIDSRSHMLKPGFFPCIPGWHHDAVPRTGPGGQPDYGDGTPAYQAKHFMALVNGDLAPTEFFSGKIGLELPAKGNIYKKWHDDIETLRQTHGSSFSSAPSNQIIAFDWQTFHRGTAAVGSGWRWFARATIGIVGKKPRNEIRAQVQAYVPFESLGW